MKKEIKNHLKELKEKHGKEHIGCDFGMDKFNTKKKKLLPAEIETANAPTGGKGKGGGKPPKGGGGTGGGNSGVVLLDFTGYTVSGTSWNYAGDIVCSPANLTAQQVDEVLTNVENEYAPYNVLITTDEAIYNAAPANRRMRVVFTETWEWYGQAGGVAFIDSFTWGDNTPCFVFTSLLNYSAKFIKEAAAHEIGHTMGLLHQSKWTEDCIKTAEYNTGNGVEAPIMGVGYYVPDAGSKWWVGPTPYSCTDIQDDNQLLTRLLGVK